MREAEGASAIPDIVETPYQRRQAGTVNPLDPFEVDDKVAVALA